MPSRNTNARSLPELGRLIFSNIEEYLLVSSLAFSVVLVFLQVVMRYCFRSSIFWSEELARYLFLWQIWLGASFAAKEGRHLRIEALRGFFSERGAKRLEVFALLIWLAFCVFLARESAALTRMLYIRGQVSPAMRIPMCWAYASVPVGCLLMATRLLQNLFGKRLHVRGSGLIFFAMALLAVFTPLPRIGFIDQLIAHFIAAFLELLPGSSDLFILFGSLVLFLTLSIPIGISLGLATAITIYTSSSIPLVMIAQNAFTALDSFPLLAIPFFMLAGSLMSYGGISRRLVRLAEGMVGWISGGLAMVTTVACMFFAAISGSGPATVSAIGSFMIPAMKEKKYDEDFAAALTAAAGSIGVIIPPSIPFVIYCVIVNVSVADLFIAGIVPGLIIGFSLMGLSFVVAKKRGYPKAERREGDGRSFISALIDALWALMVPVIILGGIYQGVFTPTEAAVVAVVYALLVGVFIYRELDWQTMKEAFRDAVLINGATSFMIGLSMAFATYLAMEQIPFRIGAFLASVSDSPVVTLLLINVILLCVGCFVDNISSMIILTPVFLPVVEGIGMDKIHFGLVMTVALAIGFVTPPYGANLFVASAISGVSIERISKRIAPIVVTMIICLALFTYFPVLSMGLVRWLR